MKKLVLLFITMLLISQTAIANPSQFVEIKRLGEGVFEGVAFSPDDSQIAVITSLGMKLYDLSDMREIAHYEGWFVDIAWSPDGKTIFLEVYPGFSWHGEHILETSFILWDVETHTVRHLLENQKNNLKAPTFSPDGSKLALVRGARQFEIWDVMTGEMLLTIETGMGNRPVVQWSSDGSKISVESDVYPLKAWDTATGEEIEPFEAAPSSPTTYDIELNTEDGTLSIIERSSDTMMAVLPNLTGSINLIFWSEAGIGSYGEVIGSCGFRYWDIEAEVIMGVEMACGDGPGSSMAYSPDDTMLAYGSSNYFTNPYDDEFAVMVMLDDDPEGMQKAAILRGHTDSVISVNWSSDSSLLASTSADGTTIIWRIARDGDLIKGESLLILEGHEGAVTAAAFSPDNRYVATAGEDGTVRIWDNETGDILAILEGHRGMVSDVIWSYDGAQVASGGIDGTIRIWGIP